MGRFYDGDIQGKFWFGIQYSDDVENLITVKPYTHHSWKVCDCVAEIEDETYCKGCYDCITSHIDAAVEEERYEDECLYYEECSHGYNLDKSTHYQELIDNMVKLKNEIPPNIITEFENIEQNDNILDAFTHIFDKTHTLVNKITDEFIYLDSNKNQIAKMVARYTLGYQIEYCLRTTDTCNISCEY
jgi:hypothetical protein